MKKQLSLLDSITGIEDDWIDIFKERCKLNGVEWKVTEHFDFMIRTKADEWFSITNINDLDHIIRFKGFYREI